MTDLVEALRIEGNLRINEKEATFGNWKSREDRIADDLCHQAASRISQQDAEIERVMREVETLERGLAGSTGIRSVSGGDEYSVQVHFGGLDTMNAYLDGIRSICAALRAKAEETKP